jgi:hypothetical protein
MSRNSEPGSSPQWKQEASILIRSPPMKRASDRFTIIEVITAMGLMAFAALSMATLLDINNNSLRNSSQRVDTTNLTNLIKMDLDSGVACNQTMTAAVLKFPVPPPQNFVLPMNQVVTGVAPFTPIAAVAPGIPNVFGTVALSAPASLSLQNFRPNGANL